MKTNAKQSDFSFKEFRNLKCHFGGSNLKSNPKKARPISTKDLMHVVVKSELAQGRYSFLNFERTLLSLLKGLAVRLNVEVCDVVVMRNHIHLALRVRSRRAFQNYLRALTGLVARKVLGAEKNRPSHLKKFFKGRPFSRIVAAGKRSFRILANYFSLNRLEKRGFSKSESRAWGLVDGMAPPIFNSNASR
jgi:REP element-mobilizing transposase RayT